MQNGAIFKKGYVECESVQGYYEIWPLCLSLFLYYSEINRIGIDDACEGRQVFMILVPNELHSMKFRWFISVTLKL